MKNLNAAFDTLEELSLFIESNDIKDSSSVLVQVFCANIDISLIKDIQELIKQKLPSCVLIGTTTDGVIDSEKIYYKTQNVATFSIFEETQLKSKTVIYKDCDQCHFEAGKEIASAMLHKDLKSIICFADGIYTNGEDLVKGIESKTPDVVLAGGMAGDNGELKETYIFNNEQLSNKGAVAVGLINKNLQVTSNYTFNWIPIGKKMRVTKALNNRVYELDGLPIVDVYAKYMGKELASQLPRIGIEFPLIFEKEGVSIGRAVLAKHDDGSLTFAGNIDAYESVRFGVGDVDSILDTGMNEIETFIREQKYQSEGIFIYSCMARRRFLDQYARHELEALSTMGIGSGFFTYGEFFHFNNKNQLLNETMTFISLSENSHEAQNSLLVGEKLEHSPLVKTEHVLANLVNTVSNELAELNENLEERVREKSDYIFKQAYIDKLTGLPNRISLINTLDRYKDKILLLINIDEFSTINDFYGYKVGDETLQQVAETLSLYVQKNNSNLYKLPSDEFVIILDIKNDKELIAKYLKEIIQEVDAIEYCYDEHQINIGITLSAAKITEDRTGLINADMTLKLAKEQGKSYLIYDEDLQLAQQYAKNVQIATLIKEALKKDGIIPYYQPIVDIKTNKVVKYEALVRLKQSDGNVLAPYLFLDISKKIRLYKNITERMIEQTFLFFSKNGLDFSINLDFDDIASPRINKFLFNKMQEYGIAKQLTIEILETQEFEDPKIVELFVQNVYKHNAKIAIDDFGSGYANFEYITNIQSDFMKIDGSLIKNIDKDVNARIITETIIGFARKLGKKVIAEFVHSKEVYDIVKELDVDFVQGYYLGEPKESV